MFWGDSHVQQLVSLVQRVHDRGLLGDHSAIFVIAAGCPPTEHLNRANGYHCDSFSHFAMLRAQQDDIDTVFIAFAFPRAADLCPSVDGQCVARLAPEEVRRRLFEQLSSQIQLLQRRGKHVILSLPFPIFN